VGKKHLGVLFKPITQVTPGHPVGTRLTCVPTNPQHTDYLKMPDHFAQQLGHG